MTRRLVLSGQQEGELRQLRDQAPEPYLRERRLETVGAWLTRYLAAGVAGLSIQPGRGRKPAFFPSAPDGASRPRGAAGRGAPRARAVGAGADPLDAAQPAGGV